MTDKNKSFHDQAMRKFERAIALIKEAAYLEYCAAQQCQSTDDMRSILWVSAANLNCLAREDARTFDCAIKALRPLGTKKEKHLRCQLRESLIRSVRQCAFNKVPTDVLDSSNDYVELLVMPTGVAYEQFGTTEGVEIQYEDFNRDYWFDDAELRPRLIATLEKHGLKQGVNFLIDGESSYVIKIVSALDNVLDELERFIALLEDLAVETDKPQLTLSESFDVLRQEIGHFYNGIDPIEWVEEQRRD